MSTAPKMTEADLCAAFIAAVPKQERRGLSKWVAYPETAGFDILLVRADGFQIGIEAKLALNSRVVSQILPYREGWHYGTTAGPDCRAVLVPSEKCNADLVRICAALGVTVIRLHTDPLKHGGHWGNPFSPYLPDERTGLGTDEWHPWAPPECCPVPEYVPDVQAGASAPVKLSEWKVKAIRLSVILEERAVTRADFKALQLSPTNWLCPRGWLERGEGGGWVRCARTPDFETQHPTNYAQIRADRARWMPTVPAPRPVQVAML
ncbi:hypothetical protein [Methylorubrum extorquens]|uniref:Uncharacterized protein n=1 Tax=Methylorubrum extorquens TaxID=408 RepID=A0AAX3WFB0_METEX|nr:hypothetical protein [Methylorubrum extorquens]WHQ69454.1 hypothetical protein KEC54_24455 [Methylorubrum extorquens]